MTGTVDVDVDEGAGETAPAHPLAEEPKVSLVKRTPPRRAPVPVTGPVTGPVPALLPVEDEDGDRLAVDEPLLAARTHRPSDLIRFVTGLLGVIAVFVLASIATETTSGIGQDIHSNVKDVAPWLITVLGLVSTVAVLAVPLAFAVERLIKRDGLRVADGVLASVLAYGVTLAIDWWVAEAASQSIRGALTQIPVTGGPITEPVHGYLAPVIAYMTAVGMVSRPRWRLALWSVVLLSGATELISSDTTPLSLLLTVLIGWSVACGTLYAIGSPNIRPTGQHLMLGLRRLGFTPKNAHRAPDAPGGTRRYFVNQQDSRDLDVHIIDREQQASGFFYRVWRRARLRSVAVRRSPQSLRQALEQEALIAYAAAAAGARAPQLVATSELGPDAAVLVYQKVEGRTLDELADDEITDEVMASCWESVGALHQRRIAHRRLTGESLLVVDEKVGVLVNLSGGDIAAGDLTLRIDVAQLLTTFALRIGPERSVATANRVLGAERVAAALPLLQPVGMSRQTRADLAKQGKERKAEAQALALEQVAAGEKSREEAEEDIAAAGEDLLSRIRGQILEIAPEAPLAPAKLERLKPKTLITVIALAFAAYLAMTTIQPGQLKLSHMNWAWAAAALAFSAISYVAAAMSLTGFVPERLPFRRTIAAQLAGSFVKLVAPAAIGGIALNTRYLQKQGVRPGQAVASVGASQLAGLGGHLTLLFCFGLITGSQGDGNVGSERAVIIGVLTAAVLALVIAAVGPMRRFVVTRVRSLFFGVVPRMLDLMQTPSKLVTGFGGIVLLTLAFTACLDASVRAFGGSMSFATVAVIFLTANAAGSAVPTPGGIGAIEGALIVTMSLAMPAATATSAVFLFRALTFWLPVLPGWISYSYLQRKGAL
ncbi:flippase-like domain-containing protein [Kitasatospora sp. NBC_01287]|uniref:lysylphosphatidylglycerol synthase transmembrane domain-containing protein n=1 Tax=Kitasatospora sp. NBC_01287 TaxID=2903573 RepID=UPI0022535A00|nr:lysylphosphatidylglycerol synthase transmembrane domain-containing protein [Kitasatospora sp. NBC_01287]MCX4746887.1 flippase-like domain-containing protein [Kitasatospora sp. NBC_01287]